MGTVSASAGRGGLFGRGRLLRRPPLELRHDRVEGHLARFEKDEEVVENVGRLGRESAGIALDTGNHCLMASSPNFRAQ